MVGEKAINAAWYAVLLSGIWCCNFSFGPWHFEDPFELLRAIVRYEAAFLPTDSFLPNDRMSGHVVVHFNIIMDEQIGTSCLRVPFPQEPSRPFVQKIKLDEAQRQSLPNLSLQVSKCIYKMWNGWVNKVTLARSQGYLACNLACVHLLSVVMMKNRSHF